MGHPLILREDLKNFKLPYSNGCNQFAMNCQPIIDFDRSNTNLQQHAFNCQSNYKNFISSINPYLQLPNYCLLNLNKIAFLNRPINYISPCSTLSNSSQSTIESAMFPCPTVDSRKEYHSNSRSTYDPVPNDDQKADAISSTDFERLLNLAESLLKRYKQEPSNPPSKLIYLKFIDLC